MATNVRKKTKAEPRLREGSVKVDLKFYDDTFKDKPIKLSFFKQKSGVDLPTHTDRGHEVSFNIVLSEKRSPITFNEVGDVEYEQALINVSKKHSVKKHSDERLLMKYLVYDIQFDEAVKRWKTTT